MSKVIRISEVDKSKVSRQDKVLQATWKLRQKDESQYKSDENPPGTRKLAACLPECRNMEYRNVDKIIHYLEKLRMSAINATFSMVSF